MSKARSSDVEFSSDLPIWIVLIGSVLALVAFFGWILQDQPLRVASAPDEAVLVQSPPEASASARAEVTTQPLNGARAVTDVDTSAVAENKVTTYPSSEETAEDETAVDSAGQGREPTPAPAPESVDASVSATGQAGSEQEQANDDSRTEDQLASEPSRSVSAPLPVQSPPDVSLTTDLVEVSVEDLEPAAVERDAVPETAEPETTEPLSTDLSTDLGALRQLLAEAAAIDQTADESAPERIERERREALESLGELSADIQFAAGSKVISEAVASTLTRIERVLAAYPETSISVIVTTNESGEDRRDRLLSQERGRAVIAWFVNQGLAFSRFSLEASTDEQLPADSNRVDIQARSES